MNKENRYFLDIFWRYVLLMASAWSNLFVFYFVFTPLTIYTVYFLLNLFFSVTLSGSNIYFTNDFTISIIPACVAGAAYYLLFILILSVPKIKISRRLFLILIAFSSFFIVNILRIFFLSVIYFYDFPYSDLIHKILWYFGSIVLTAGIWFLEVYFFKIKETPFYSDLKFLYKKSLFKKK